LRKWLAEDASGLECARRGDVPLLERVGLGDGGAIEGIDLEGLRRREECTRERGEERQANGLEGEEIMKTKLVLMGIRELGNEDYYQRRGYRSVWSGKVPVGMWDCKEECTMVYMEKDVGRSWTEHCPV
jgi:hypothetical protein